MLAEVKGAWVDVEDSEPAKVLKDEDADEEGLRLEALAPAEEVCTDDDVDTTLMLTDVNGDEGDSRLEALALMEEV